MKHHYHKGYFDYDNDGFGKVTKTENDTIDEIEYYIKNNCKKFTVFIIIPFYQ